jgi:hypothetical protein
MKTHPTITRLITPAIAAVLGSVFSITPARAGEKQADIKQIEQPKPETDWEVKLSMPGWIPATAGDIGVDGHASHTYLSAENFVKHIDMVAALAAEVRRDRIGIYGEMIHASLSDGADPDGLLSKVDIRLDSYIANMELFYRVWEGSRGFLDVRAGVRYTNIYNKVTLDPDDDAIGTASSRLVENVADRVREILGKLPVAVPRDAIAENITGKLGILDGKDYTLPVAALGHGEPEKINRNIQGIIERRSDALVEAFKAKAAAVTDAERAAAQKKINAVKDKLSKEIANAVSSGLNRTMSLTEYWFDPYIGLRARYNLSKAFYLTAKADVGGFGIGSDITCQASGALGCQVTQNIYAELGYRYLYTDYDHDNFIYRVDMQGVELTMGFVF